MNLTEEQVEAVKRWIQEPADLSEIQARLKKEFGVALTYMDTRFLIDDLKLTVADKPEPEEPAEDLPQDGAETPPDATATAAEADAIDPGPAGAGKVSVTIDQITKPNAMVSGKVTFSDGENSEWMLDQSGRLALNPTTPGYRPSQDDVMGFQMELQRIAQTQGF